ncbi:MAG TPA: hypothetical protein VEL07_03330 [Planctomycetota bacterium]|nr:hypothetical protein [Planctomycetota bacterium]
MDLRALTIVKRLFRTFASVERGQLAGLLRTEMPCDERRAQQVVDDLIDGGYLFERDVDGTMTITPGPNLDSGVLSLVGITIPPR